MKDIRSLGSLKYSKSKTLVKVKISEIEQGLNVSFCLYDWYTSSNGSLLNIDFNNLGTINEIKEKYFDNNIVNQQCDVADKYLGKILNLDMQPIFCFKVKTFETDTNSLVENKNC